MRKRILPFAVAGTIGFIVDAGLLLIFSPVFGFLFGRLLSFAAAVATTWSINRKYAFADKAAQVNKRQEFQRYFLAMLPGAVVNWLAYGVAVMLLPRGPLSLAFAVAVGSIAGLATNLIAADRLAFRATR